MSQIVRTTICPRFRRLERVVAPRNSCLFRECRDAADAVLESPRVCGKTPAMLGVARRAAHRPNLGSFSLRVAACVLVSTAAGACAPAAAETTAPAAKPTESTDATEPTATGGADDSLASASADQCPEPAEPTTEAAPSDATPGAKILNPEVAKERKFSASQGDANEPRGSLEPAVVRKVVRSHLNEVGACYRVGLDSCPKLTGQVTITFVIDANGRVSQSAVAKSSLGYPDVEACIVAASREWAFPQPQGGGNVVISYPFSLTPD